MELNDFYHKQVLAEEQIDIKTLPQELRYQITGFDLGYRAYLKYGSKQDTLNKLKKTDALLADEIQTWIEKDLPEETNENENTMTPEQEALIKRARAVKLPDTATEQEIVDAETKQQQLAVRAKAVKLPEDSSEEDIVKAEQENDQKLALAKRAGAVGLPENATLEQIEAKEAENKNTPSSTPNKDEANKQVVRDSLQKWGKVYYSDLQKVVKFETGTELVEFEGVKLKRKVAYYHK